MPTPHEKMPREIAARLEISPSTLRRWSEEFAEFLSEQASSSQGKSHRRYTEEDEATLLAIKALMDDGLTYAQVRRRMNQQPPEVPAPGGELVSAAEASLAPMTYFAEAIDELHQGQLSVLNSQAANRELMGVLIQDNLNIKEENKRLRERMLSLEREIGRLRREEISRREVLRREVEARLAEIRALATRNPVTVLQNRVGCLGSLLGLGGKIQATQHPAPSSHTPKKAPPRPPGPPE